MITRHSRIVAAGVLFLMMDVVQSSRTSLRGNQRQLADAEAVQGTLDFAEMNGFSDISEDFRDLDIAMNGYGPINYLDLLDISVGNSTKFDEDGRIIGGTTAATSNFMVPNNQCMLLRQTGYSNGQPSYAPNNCGGTLITRCHVLTAGHCIGRYGANDAVLVNARNPYDPNNNRAPKWKSTVASEESHPNYRSGSKPYDMGIIRLSQCVPSNMLSQLPPAKICSSVPSTGTDMVVAGFGRTNPNVQSSASQMKAVQIRKISATLCSQAYGSQIDQTQYCAGDWNGGRDSCQGDSGGGLYKGTSTYSQELCGVVSWGSGCAQRQKPGVYASVPNLKSWIQGRVCGTVNGMSMSSSPICGGSGYSMSNNKDTYGTGSGDVDCTYSSGKKVTFTDPKTKQQKPGVFCKFMVPAWPNVGGVDYNQYCSVPEVAATCQFACHSSCPLA